MAVAGFGDPALEAPVPDVTWGDAPVAVDGNITTSKGMGTAIAFGLAIVAHYRGQDVADELGRKIVYGG